MRRRPHLLSPGPPAAALAVLALAATALPAAPAGAQPGGWTLGTQLVTGGLTQPVGIAHAGDGSGRLFLIERAGVIRIWDGVSLLPAPFLDVSALVDPTGPEQGLLGLAFHPDYETNGFFYIDYTRDPGPGLDRTVVARYQVSAGDPDVADAGSALVLFEIEQPAQNHNGGDLHFGPDGFLYISSGDGGGSPQNGQMVDTLLGKILRIDVDAAPPPGPNEVCGLGAQGYGIPPGNPFPGAADGCDEIWAYGLRNPWRLSFDRLTGDLFIGDVGQNQWEEIDFEPLAVMPPSNFGWDCWEGNHVFDPTGCGPASDYDFPILEYDHDLGCSVAGGYRYRGAAQPDMQGTYFYGDFCSGRIWGALPGCGGVWREVELLDSAISITAFGEDEAGELYVLGLNGQLHRLVVAGPAPVIFDGGFEFGDLSEWTACGP
jgi:glucose/arabinose dehydrogenase